MGAMGMAHMFEHMASKGNKEIGTTNYKKEKKWMDEEDRIFELILQARARGDRADTVKLADLEEQLKVATDSASSYIITNEFKEISKSNGGVGLNAGTSRDYTKYYVNYPSNKLELWMAMESERFANPVLRDLFKEKQVVAEERRYRVESSPTGRMFQAEYVGLAFNGHPYGKCIIGEANEIQNYNRPDMLKQFKSHYIPRNMVIAIVGDVEPDNAIKLAEKYFSGLEDKPAPRPVMIKEPAPYGVRTTTMIENSQPMFLTGFHIPSNTHPDWIALDALSDYLGSGRTSALYKKLVKENKTAVAADAFTGYPASKYSSLFSIFCIPTNESSNGENEKTILEEIEKVKNELISNEELDKIKIRAKAGFINGLASNSGMANQLTAYQTRTGDWRDMFRVLDKINALTPEDIQRVANEYLDPDKRVVVYMEKPEDEV
jgi:predicted Zn-dependent peptidase